VDARVKPGHDGGEAVSTFQTALSLLKHSFAISPHDPREFCIDISLPSVRGRRRPSREGAGNAGRSTRPQPVCIGSEHTVVTTVTPETPDIPRAMVLTAYSALSPATNSSCHRRQRIEGPAGPGWADIASAGLTPATGARTTRLCRTQPPPAPGCLDGPCAVHRGLGEGEKRHSSYAPFFAHGKPPCDTVTRLTLPRPPHPAPRS
jgi:hypothetical protein